MPSLSTKRPRILRHAPPRARTVGLLAGSGRFPILFAEAAVRQGWEVACVGIRYEAPEELCHLCTSWVVPVGAKSSRTMS